MQAADTDGNGDINYTGKYLVLSRVFLITRWKNFENITKVLISIFFMLEFIAATMDAKTFLKESYLKTAFNMFDTDGSGKIDASELNTLLSGEEFKDVYSNAQLMQAIAEVD